MGASEESDPASARPSLGARLRTTATSLFVASLFAVFAYISFVTFQTTGRFQMLIISVQESLIVFLVVTRRPTIDESHAPFDWVIAVAGTAAPLLQRPGTLLVPILQPIGVSFQILGASLSVIAATSLARSFGIVAANRGVQTDGLYRFVRHPLYGSYLISYFGFLLGNVSVANVILIALTCLCHYLRAAAEERVLLRDPEYQTYAARVRSRFVPYLF
jgi:protein-S-isoprenylcysteine O-methyltransferase Ste14